MRSVLHRVIGSLCLLVLAFSSVAVAAAAIPCAPVKACPMMQAMADSHCQPVASLKADCCSIRAQAGEVADLPKRIAPPERAGLSDLAASPVLWKRFDSEVVVEHPPPDESVALFTLFQALLI